MDIIELKKQDFDFSVLPKDINESIALLGFLTDGTFESDNQKLILLDYTIFNSINALHSDNPKVSSVMTMREAEENTIVNDGFNTKGLDSSVADDYIAEGKHIADEYEEGSNEEHNFADGGTIDFEEGRDMRGIEIGDFIDFGGKGKKYVSQFDGERLIVVDSRDDVGSSKGSLLYPSSARKIIEREEDFADGGELDFKEKSTTNTNTGISYTTITLPEGEIVIGFIGEDKEGFIDSVKVSENKRRQGIGSKLLKEALRRYPNVWGQASNDKAVGMNYKLGMRAFSDDGKELSLQDTLQKRADQTSVGMHSRNLKAEGYADGGEVSKKLYILTVYVAYGKRGQPKNEHFVGELTRSIWANSEKEALREEKKNVRKEYRGNVFSKLSAKVIETLTFDEYIKREQEKENFSDGGEVDSNTKKLVDMLNEHKPAKLQWDRGTLWINAGNGLQKGSITSKFKGFGDSTDIGNIVWRGVRSENAKETIEKLTDGEYTIKQDFHNEPYVAKSDYFEDGGSTSIKYYHGSPNKFEDIKYTPKSSGESNYLGKGIYITNDKETALSYAGDNYLYEITASEPIKSIPFREALSTKDINQIIERFKKSDDTELNHWGEWYEERLEDGEQVYGQEIMADLERNDVDVSQALIYAGFNGIDSPLNYLNAFKQLPDSVKQINVIKEGILDIELLDKDKMADGGSTEKRYVAEADFYVYGKDDAEATKNANDIAREIDSKHDNKATVNHLHEQPFGQLGFSRRIFAKGGILDNLSTTYWYVKEDNAMYPKGRFIIWVYDDVDAGKKLQNREFDYILSFPRPSQQSFTNNDGWIDMLFSKEFIDKKKGGDKLVGMLEGQYLEEAVDGYKANTTVLLNASVREEFQRKGVMGGMVKFAQELTKVPRENIKFDSDQSPMMERFVESGKYEDGGNINTNEPVVIFEEGGVNELQYHRYLANSFNSPFTKISDKVKDYDGVFSLQSQIPFYDDVVEDSVQGQRGYFFFYKGHIGEIVLMNPTEYLKRVREGFGNLQDEGIMDVKKEAILEGINNGEKIDAPYLSYEEGRFNQEGRNRAYVARELGIKEMPVLIVKGVSQSDKKWKAEELIEEAMEDVGSNQESIIEYLKQNYDLHRDSIYYIRNSDKFKELEGGFADGGEVEYTLPKTYSKKKGWMITNGNEIEAIDDMQSYFDDESLPEGRITDNFDDFDAVMDAVGLGYKVGRGKGDSGENAFIIRGKNKKNPKKYSKTQINKALKDLERTRGVKYWNQPEFPNETYKYEDISTGGNPNTILNLRDGLTNDFLAYDYKGNLVSLLTISEGFTRSGGYEEKKGLYKIVTKEKSEGKGWGSKLLDEAIKSGVDIIGNININSFTHSGRYLFRKWLNSLLK